MTTLLLILFTTALLGAEPAKTVTIPMFIEHDAWALSCQDDPTVAGTQGFGLRYSSTNRALAVGHKYRVSGTMGWSFLLTVDTNGTPSVSDIQAGPNLAKPPVIRVATEDTDFKNPVEVVFGHIKRVQVSRCRWTTWAGRFPTPILFVQAVIEKCNCPTASGKCAGAAGLVGSACRRGAEW